MSASRSSIVSVLTRLCLGAALCACDSSSSDKQPASGTEGGSCVEGECDDGLVCLSNLCVNPGDGGEATSEDGGLPAAEDSGMPPKDDCPEDDDKSEPGVCGCGVEEVDADGDGVCDSNGDDACPDDHEKSEAGICGCGIIELDADKDGACDSNGDDTCPDDDKKTEPGACGCGVKKADADGDGACDSNGDDACPDDKKKTSPGICGCGYEDLDADKDGACDTNGDDACPDDNKKVAGGLCGCGEEDVDADDDAACDSRYLSPTSYWYLDEWGDSFTDHGSYGIDATEQGTSEIVAGPLNAARRTPTQSSTIRLDDNTEYRWQPTDSWSMEFWFNEEDAFNNGESAVFRIEEGTGIVDFPDDYVFTIQVTPWDGTGNFALYMHKEVYGGANESAYVNTTDVTYDNGLWHHWVFTYDGSRTQSGVKIYVDGVLRNTAASGTWPESFDWSDDVYQQIGGHSMIYCSFDEVAIYDGVLLTQADVDFRYNAGAAHRAMSYNP